MNVVYTQENIMPQGKWETSNISYTEGAIFDLPKQNEIIGRRRRQEDKKKHYHLPELTRGHIDFSIISLIQ